MSGNSFFDGMLVGGLGSVLITGSLILTLDVESDKRAIAEAEKSPAWVYDAICNVGGAEVKGQASVKATFMREGNLLYPEITIETSTFKDANGSVYSFPEGTKCRYSRTVESVKKAAPKAP